MRERNGIKFFGSHTVVGILNENKLFDLKYIKENGGRLPPYIIAVGDRRRVWKAKNLLEEFVLLDEEAKRFGLDFAGRVAVAVGKFKGVPVCVFETQMGCPATQINANEILYFSDDEGYFVDGDRVVSDGIYIIRVGTCAGINAGDNVAPVLEIGDVVISERSFGSVGAILQSYIGKINFLDGVERKDIISSRLVKEAISLDGRDRTLMAEESEVIIYSLKAHAENKRIRYFVGNDFTKDSLYAEFSEEDFVFLRKNYGVITTEMEQLSIDALAAVYRNAGIPVHSGLISSVVGVIPGKSFPDKEEEFRKVERAEQNSLEIALNALYSIAKSKNRGL
ncbi:MAG: hypothetical protein QXY61_03410 [Candidatus Anstonellales archaeon]